MVPYKLLGGTQVKAISLSFGGILDRWIAEWSFSKPSVSVNVVAANIKAAKVPEKSKSFVSFGADTSSGFFCDAAALDWRHFFFEISGSDCSDEEIRKLSSAALADLASSFANGKALSTLDEARIQKEGQASLWSVFSLKLGSLGSLCLAAPNFFFTALPGVSFLGQRKSEAAFLHKRSAVAKGGRCLLQVKHSLGTMSVAKLRGLKVGDVLISDEQVDGSFRMLVGSSLNVECALGQLEHNKAVIVGGEK